MGKCGNSLAVNRYNHLETDFTRDKKIESFKIYLKIIDKIVVVKCLKPEQIGFTFQKFLM